MSKKWICIVNIKVFAFFDMSQGPDSYRLALFSHSVTRIGHTIMS